MGFIRVANEAMCRPIRALTQVFWVLKCQLQLESLLLNIHVFFLYFSLTQPPPPPSLAG